MHLPGLIVPPLTPFTEQLEIDYDALQLGIDYVVTQCHAGMVIAAGVEAQEYQYLHLEERKELVRQTIAMVDRRSEIAVGISHPSFRVAIEMAHLAQRHGATALQILAPLRPFGGEPTTTELVAYFTSIIRETDLPIVLYLNAGPGANLSITTTIELAQMDRISYIKESSRDLSRVSRLIAEIEKPGHAHYFTTLQMLLITLQLGGSGVTLPPPAARIAHLVVQAFLGGDIVEATRLQEQFSVFPARWMHHGLMPTMKAALNFLGLPAGKPYPPFQPITGDELDGLLSYLKSTDLCLPEKKHAHPA